jgi:hypothetical protein
MIQNCDVYSGKEPHFFNLQLLLLLFIMIAPTTSSSGDKHICKPITLSPEEPVPSGGYRDEQ